MPESTFRHKSSPYVLKNKNKTLAKKSRKETPAEGKAHFLIIWFYIIRCSVKQYGIGFTIIPGGINYGVKFYPIPHGNLILSLCIVLNQVKGIFIYSFNFKGINN